MALRGRYVRQYVAHAPGRNTGSQLRNPGARGSGKTRQLQMPAGQVTTRISRDG